LSEYGLSIFQNELIKKEILKPFILKHKKITTLPTNFLSVGKEITQEKKTEIIKLDKLMRILRFTIDDYLSYVQDYFFDEVIGDNFLYFNARFLVKDQKYNLFFTNNPNYVNLSEDAHTKTTVFTKTDDNQNEINNSSFEFIAHIDSNSQVELSHVERMPVLSFPSLEDAIEAWQKEGRTLPAAAVFALAGPTGADEVHFTNSSWVVSASATKARFGFQSVTLVNDFALINSFAYSIECILAFFLSQTIPPSIVLNFVLLFALFHL
jgi:hypothetical protein